MPLSDSELCDDTVASKKTKSQPDAQSSKPHCQDTKYTNTVDFSKEGPGTTSEPAMMTKKFFYRFLPKEAIYESDGHTSTLTLTFTSEHGKFSSTKSLVCAGVITCFFNRYYHEILGYIETLLSVYTEQKASLKLLKK